jgi:hypothetical protein
MSRPLRIIYDGAWYHVMNRGRRGENIFPEAGDLKEEIVALLRNGSTKAFAADRYGTSQVNLYNWLNKNNLDVSSQKACV